ncbi:MAG: HD domain-containing protein [Caldilineaceae bacterium]|nr:HD domain-containing protein [Caldilineaceae bacterium]
MVSERLSRQLQFILEIDRLKGVLRRSLLLESRRRENSAEHSWHLAMMALVLAEHANETVNLLHTLKLLLIHDVVEIDAGDTYAYDDDSHDGKIERERTAAIRIFGLLPPDQAAEMTALWEEYEAQQTPEARFALALDRFMPFLHNYHTGGITWRENRVTRAQVEDRMSPVGTGSDALGAAVAAVVEEATARGLLPRNWPNR